MNKKNLIKKFTYNISWEDLPHTQETVMAALGTNYYNSDFPVDTHALQNIQTLFQDARAFCFMFKIKEMAKKPTTQAERDSKASTLKWYNQKLKFYDKVEASLKLVSIE